MQECKGCSPTLSASPRRTPVAPALTASPISSPMLSLRLRTSAADTTIMKAGSVSLACFLPAGNTATCEAEAATVRLEAAPSLSLLQLRHCPLLAPFNRCGSGKRDCWSTMRPLWLLQNKLCWHAVLPLTSNRSSGVLVRGMRSPILMSGKFHNYSCRLIALSALRDAPSCSEADLYTSSMIHHACTVAVSYPRFQILHADLQQYKVDGHRRIKGPQASRCKKNSEGAGLSDDTQTVGM